MLQLAVAGLVVLASLFLLSFKFFSNASKNSLEQTKNSKEKKVFTAAEVEKHRFRNDCWIIINNKVYDVTSYVEEHPGGDSILNNAGNDSTTGFYGPQHVTRVFQMIDDYYIGDVSS